MKVIIETERLIIRQIQATDTDDMFELHTDPEVHKYLANKTVKNKEEIIEIIRFLNQQYEDYGVGRWAIIDKKTNDFIGWTGLEYVTKEVNNHKNYYDLGYRLHRKFWGNGIATESALASLDYGFDHLSLKEIHAIADCQNEGSNKILKKIGFQYIEQFLLDEVPHNWYKIDKKAYTERK